MREIGFGLTLTRLTWLVLIKLSLYYHAVKSVKTKERVKLHKFSESLMSFHLDASYIFALFVTFLCFLFVEISLACRRSIKCLKTNNNNLYDC